MTELELVKRQLVAIRDLAETTLGLLEGDGMAAAAADCPHPKDQRRPAGVMGAPDQFLCTACHTLVNPGAPVDAAPAPVGEG